MHCEFCDVELTGGTDTFGRLGEVFCAVCYLSLQESEVEYKLESRHIGEEYQQTVAEIEEAKKKLKIAIIHRQKREQMKFRRELNRLKPREDSLWWASKFIPMSMPDAPNYARASGPHQAPPAQR